MSKSRPEEWKAVAKESTTTSGSSRLERSDLEMSEHRTAKREMFVLTKEVRAAQSHVGGKSKVSHQEIRRDGSQDGSETKPIQPLEDRLTELQKEFELRIQSEQKLPPPQISGRTLRFEADSLEAGYTTEVVEKSLHIAVTVIVFLFLYSANTGFARLQINRRTSALLYFILVFISILYGALFITLKKKFNSREQKDFYTRLYIRAHGSMYFVLMTIFSLQIKFFQASRVLTENEIVMLLAVVTLPGDYRTQLFVTIYANILPFFLLVISTSDMHVIYRCMMPLISTSLVSIITLQILDRQRRNSYYARLKMTFLKEEIMSTKEKTKAILSNLYPIPVVNHLVHNTNIPSYSSHKALVVCISIESRLTLKGLPQSIKEVEKAYAITARIMDRFKIHKVKSAGLILVGVSGLFGEDIADILPFCQHLHKRLKKTVPSMMISIGIATGRVEGGIITYSKHSFDLIGEAYDKAMEGHLLCSPGEICVDEHTKNEFLQKINIVSSIHIHTFSEHETRKGMWFLQLKDGCNLELIRNGIAGGRNNTILSEGHSVKDDNFAISPRTEIQDEYIDKMSDPFLRARKERGWIAYLGVLDFRDGVLEKEFSNSLRTVQNKFPIGIQLMVYVMCTLLFGVIDIGLLNKYVDLDFQIQFYIFARFYILCPILLLFCLAFAFGDAKEHTYHAYFNVWMIPYIVSAMTVAFSFFRATLVYSHNIHPYLSTFDNVFFFFSEVYQTGYFYISIFTIRPRRIALQYVIWTAYSCMMYYLYGENMGIPQEDTISFCVSLILIPFALFWVFTTFRDYSARKEFLDGEYLKETIKKASEEHECAEQALISTLGVKIADNIMSESCLKIENSTEEAVILLRFNHSRFFKQETQTEEKFSELSDLVVIIERECYEFGLEISRTLGDIILIQPISSLNSKDAPKNQPKYTDKNKSRSIVQFSLHIIQNLRKIAGLNGSYEFYISICIDVGEVFNGIMGEEKLTFDVFGEPVIKAIHMSQRASPSGIYVTHAFREKLSGISCFDDMFSYRLHLKGEETDIYTLQEKTDVWGMFIQYIPWVADTAESDDANL